MNQNYNETPNGYLESINKGIQTARKLSGHMTRGKGTKEERVQRLIDELRNADAIVIGAGAGLSTSAGLTYSGERFDKYFGDFKAKYSIRDMYAGGFYPFPDAEYLHVCEFYGGRFVRPLLSVSDSGGSMSLQFQNNHCAAEQIRSTQVSTPNVELFSERS